MAISTRALIGRLVAVGVALLAGLTGLAAAPGAAYAESVAVDDPAGDAIRYYYEEDRVEPAPAARFVDTVRTHVDYRTQVLVVRITLVRSRTTERFLRVRGGGHDETFRAVSLGRIYDAQNDIVPGSDHRISRENDTVTLKLPAAAFGAPERIRVGVGSSDLPGGVQAEVIDDAQRVGVLDPGEDRFVLGAPLTRG